MIAPAREPESDDGPKVDLKAVAYALHLRGRSQKEIAEAVGKSQGTISRWIAKAADKGLLDKLEHPREFGLRLECTCRENPLDPDGPPIVCINCTASSRDFHPRMHANPLPKDRKLPSAEGKRGGLG